MSFLGLHIHVPKVRVGHFLGNVVKTAGLPFKEAGKAAQSAEGAITKAVGHIPVIGKPLKSVFDLALLPVLGPVENVGAILNGQRIDRVVLGDLKRSVQDVKAVAPYAQMVISLVPGVGQAVSGALGAGLALAEGQPITEALVQGVKDALPGGPVAAAAFDALHTGMKMALSGKKVTWADMAKAAVGVGGDVLGVLPDSVKATLAGVVNAAGPVARGAAAAVDQADHLLASVKGMVPLDVHKAIVTGMSLAHGQFVQAAKNLGLQAPSTAARLAHVGQAALKTDPIAKAARQTLSAPEAKKGFDLGAGLVRHTVHLHDVMVLRGQLSPAAQKGFDLAASTHVGRVAHPPPALGSPRAKAGYFATLGMQGAAPERKAAMMTALAAHPVVKQGATVAVDKVSRGRASLWQRMVRWVRGIA